MTSKEILTHLDVEGYCVIENLIPPDEIVQVRESVAGHLQAAFEENERKMAEVRGKGHRIGGAGVQAHPGIINVDQSFAPYLAHKSILEPLRALWGPYVRLRSAKGFVSRPGFTRGGLHADAPYIQGAPMRMNAPYQDFTAKVTTVWMLSSFTLENGGTILVPGTHRAENNRTGGLDLPVPHPGEVRATGPAGSVVMFDSRTWHGSGDNCSEENRVGVVMTYFPWWLGQDPSMPPGTPERERLKEETGLSDDELGAGTGLFPIEAYEALPEEVKPLLRHWVRR